MVKFYEPMYNKKPQNGPTSAIKLWSDWNTQIYEWVRSITSSLTDYKQLVGSGSNSRSAGQAHGNVDYELNYLALFTEDLMDPVTSVRFSAISHLAEWVGSNLTDEELCCLAIQETTFMGSHDRTAGKGTKKVSASSRYGKWKAKVGNNQQLQRDLESTGGPGLNLFGYKEGRTMASPNAVSKNGYQCSVSVKCVKKVKPTTVDFTMSITCKIHPGMDYKGGDLPVASAGTAKVSSLDGCCKACREKPACRYFTFVPGEESQPGNCYLKNVKAKEVFDPLRSDSIISGDML